MIEINPGDADAYFNRGKNKNDAGDHLGAIADYTKSLEVNPNFLEAYISRGNAKNEAGN